MGTEIRKAAVLGAGVMGSGIAAHLANAGIPVLLLDIVPPELTAEDEKKGLTKDDPRFRNKFSAAGLEGIKKSKPAALYSKRFLPLIEIGNFEDDWDKLADCDWIVEVIVERLDIKQQIFERVDEIRKPGSLISSNTSGLSIEGMTEGRSEDFKQHFLVTHFFNPVRYMRLLELVAGEETLPEVHRILQPGGGLGVLSYSLAGAHAVFMEIVARHCGSVRVDTESPWREALADTKLFAAVGSHVTEFREVMDPDRLVSLAASISYIAALSEPHRARVLADVRVLAAQGSGEVVIPVVCDVLALRRTG